MDRLRQTLDLAGWDTPKLVVLLVITWIGLIATACSGPDIERWQDKALWESQVKNSH